VNESNDLLLSKISVRIRNVESSQVLGTGIIYSTPELIDKVYVLTAAHNLFADGDNFQHLIPNIYIDFYGPEDGNYQTCIYETNRNLIWAETNKDIAILLLEKNEIEAILGIIPTIQIVKEKGNTNTFIIKGFPNATKGEELAIISPTWLQRLPAAETFQLQLHEDYSSWATNGFSGSGVFLKTENELYLYGIFTRYRAEEKGKVIYCQYIELANKILESNFLPLITFTFFSERDFTNTFFNRQLDTSIKNLGPRFNEKLNFKLPIAFLFNDLSKDTVFQKRLLKIFDDWLLGRDYSHDKLIKEHISEVEEGLKLSKKFLLESLPQIKWKADEQIDLAPIESQIQKLIEIGDLKLDHLYNLQRIELEKDKDKKRDHSYRYPLEGEIDHIRTINRHHHTFFNDLNEVNVSLSNMPCLIIKGEAGSGKSHLLGDIANERKKKNLPTILLLGQQFQKGQSVWQNILSQLDLHCSKDEFLKSLNNIGRQINARVLILIDAINEGAGKELWSHELSGFIAEVSKYPFIGLALTVRSTYFNQVIPTSLKANENYIEATHEGFKGNEYGALSLFCSHYELEQPNFPILSPEFSNPLFLQLICDGLKQSGQKKFPQGIHGISAIFKLYLDAIFSKLINRRDEYRLRKEMIKSAIYELAKACFEEKYSRVLPVEKAVEIFDLKFPKFQYLLDDLILENVFIQNIIKNYETEKETEVIYFAYERFGDFYIANTLLESFNSKESVRNAFKKNNELSKLLEDAYWRNKGILEAMAVLLPERFSLEIIEVFDWVFEGSHQEFLGNIDEWLNHFLIDSLKWRVIESIDNKKLTAWIRSKKFNINDHAWFNFLIELTVQKGHPFNADRLNKMLKRYTMPERDSFWLQYIKYYSFSFDNDSATPIRRLIDWAWQKDISAKIDSETARLTAQTLAWILSSTFIQVRDQTTKALVNLLEEQPEALIAVLENFKDIDDLYILERLCGVVYGCALRTSKLSSLNKIAQYVFDTFFKEANPPAHILLRDYARNTVEYALYRKIDILGNMNLIRPPHTKELPKFFPTDEDLKIYDRDPKDENYKLEFGREYGQIKFSVMSWDFGRYTIESAVRYFCPVSFRFEERYKEFVNNLEPKKKRALKKYEKRLEFNSSFEINKGKIGYHFGEEKIQELQAFVDEETTKDIEGIHKLFNEVELSFFINEIKEHLLSKQRLKESYHKPFDAEKIKRWIVKRAYDLGYDAKLHGFHDTSLNSYNDRSQNKIERIGKKYQWLALFEIVAILADNFKIESERWSSKKAYVFYNGPWHGYLRNIDPVFTTKNNDQDDDKQDFRETEISRSTWWQDKKYNYWNLPASQWINSIKDLPDPKHIIMRRDEDNIDWLYLRTHINWSEPRAVGKDKYRYDRRQFWYIIQGYLIKKRDKDKILKRFNELDFKGRWLPETHSANLSLFNRENFWSPASQENESEKWEQIRGTKFKCMVTTSEAVGELSDDKSGAHFRFDMPCRLIFEGMNLEYAPVDGEFRDNEGNIVVVNPEHSGTLVRKDFFEKFLEQNDLDIVWCILGEKDLLSGSFSASGENFYKVISGVYSLNNGEVVGSIKISNRD